MKEIKMTGKRKLFAYHFQRILDRKFRHMLLTNAFIGLYTTYSLCEKKIKSRSFGYLLPCSMHLSVILMPRWKDIQPDL